MPSIWLISWLRFDHHGPVFSLMNSTATFCKIDNGLPTIHDQDASFIKTSWQGCRYYPSINQGRIHSLVGLILGLSHGTTKKILPFSRLTHLGSLQLLPTSLLRLTYSSRSRWIMNQGPKVFRCSDPTQRRHGWRTQSSICFIGQTTLSNIESQLPQYQRARPGLSWLGLGWGFDDKVVEHSQEGVFPIPNFLYIKLIQNHLGMTTRSPSSLFTSTIPVAVLFSSWCSHLCNQSSLLGHSRRDRIVYRHCSHGI